VGLLFAAAPEALFVVRGDVIVVANDRMVQLAGHDPSGLDVHDVIPAWRGVPERTVPFEAVLRTRSDGALPVEVRARGLEGGEAVVAVRDARELIAGREAPRASRPRGSTCSCARTAAGSPRGSGSPGPMPVADFRELVVREEPLGPSL
jgi:PAS domain-containing protein